MAQVDFCVLYDNIYGQGIGHILGVSLLLSVFISGLCTLKGEIL